MTEKELDIASPGLQRENKSRNKSQTNAELTIEVGRNFENTILNLHATTFTESQMCLFTRVYKKHFNLRLFLYTEISV